MPIEAELKVHVRDAEAVRTALDAMAGAEASVYEDRYFDSRDRTFAESGRELRVRSVLGPDGARHILTYKDPAVDASGSKPEFETAVEDPEATVAIIHGLGFRGLIAFSKHCRNYRLRHQNRDLLATMVQVPEIDGDFLEVETIVPAAEDVPAALATVRSLLLGLGEEDITELYTDAVARVQSAGVVEDQLP
jgi:adenylate cyclase class 2